MSLATPTVFVTEHDDGSADFTISVNNEDHKFSAVPESESSNAILSYEETLSWRGQIRVKEPEHEVWRLLMQSDEMTAYLDSQDGLTGVRRERR